MKSLTGNRGELFPPAGDGTEWTPPLSAPDRDVPEPAIL